MVTKQWSRRDVLIEGF